MITKSQEVEFIRDGSIAKLLELTNYTRTADELVEYLNKRQLMPEDYTITDRDREALHIYPQYLTLYQNFKDYNILFTDLYVWYNGLKRMPKTKGKYPVPYQLIEWYNVCHNNSNKGPLDYIEGTFYMFTILVHFNDFVEVRDDSKPLKPLDIHSPQKREDIYRGFNTATVHDEFIAIQNLRGLIPQLNKSDYPYKKELTQDIKAYITYLRKCKWRRIKWW